MTNKKRLFDELAEGIQDINDFREGNITLRHYTVEPKPRVKVNSQFIIKVRGDLYSETLEKVDALP